MHIRNDHCQYIIRIVLEKRMLMSIGEPVNDAGWRLERGTLGWVRMTTFLKDLVASAFFSFKRPVDDTAHIVDDRETGFD